RCRHVVTENARVLKCVDALDANHLIQVGELLVQSHMSLRDDYEVSCRELDFMVDLALQQRGVLGARMTGAGFGGCTINLIEKNDVERFVEHVVVAYQNATGIKPAMYVSSAMPGAQVFQ
ncbi:MAG: galactokinase, partial [Chloroflexota bacterium]